MLAPLLLRESVDFFELRDRFVENSELESFTTTVDLCFFFPIFKIGLN